MGVAAVAAILSSGVFSALAVVHLVWAARRWWPAQSEAELVEMVVGMRGRMPSRLACLAVAVALVLAAAVVAVASATVAVAVPIEPARWLAWTAAAVFALRGLYGYVDHLLRPQIVELRFYRLNRRLYSPLCLGLATLIVISLSAS